MKVPSVPLEAPRPGNACIAGWFDLYTGAATSLLAEVQLPGYRTGWPARTRGAALLKRGPVNLTNWHGARRRRVWPRGNETTMRLARADRPPV